MPVGACQEVAAIMVEVSDSTVHSRLLHVLDSIDRAVTEIRAEIARAESDPQQEGESE